MNAAGLQMLISKVPSRPTEKIDAKNTSTGFGSVLNHAMLVNNKGNSGSEKLSKTSNEESQQLLANADIKKLLATLSKIVDGLPIEEGYLSLEMLENPQIQGLLQQLPADLSIKIEKMFQEEMPLENLLDEDAIQTPEAILSIIIAMSNIEPQQSMPKDELDLVELRKQVEGVMGLKLGEDATSFKGIVMELASLKPLDQARQNNGLIKTITNSSIDVDNLMKELLKGTNNPGHLKSLIQNEQQPNLNEKVTPEISKLINQFIQSKDKSQTDKNDFYDSIKKELLKSLDPETFNKTAINRQIDSTIIQKLIKQIDPSTQQMPVRTDVVSELANSLSVEQNQMNRIQQFVLHVNEQQPKQAQQQSMIDQFSNIFKQSKFTNLANGNNQLLIKLNPEHLGSLSIKLSQINGEMVAKIVASTSTAKELIESNLHQLRHVFTAQNINIEKLEIQVQSDQQFEQFKDQQDKEQHQDEQNEHDSSNGDDNTKDNTNSFQEELLNLMV